MTNLRIILLGCGSLAWGYGVAGMADPAAGGKADEQDKRDRAALTALYEAAGGKDWSRRDNWATDVPLNEWYGVRVSFGGVVKLDLAANGLTGSIPSELGNLRDLEHLFLDNNELAGPIPSSLGNLSRLTWLDLRHNELTGSIPAELGNISRVNRHGHRHTPRVLKLGGNSLGGTIPAALGNLLDLKELELDGNQLTGEIPSELGNLKDLRTLKLGRNKLTGKIPPQLGGLWRLDVLDLGGNQLTGRIPSGLFTWHDRSCFVVLDLGSNRLEGEIPPEVGLHDCLETLRLSGNRLEGSLPGKILDLGRLDTFHFEANQGACAPNTTDFVDWLEGIGSTSGPFCDNGADGSGDSGSGDSGGGDSGGGDSGGGDSGGGDGDGDSGGGDGDGQEDGGDGDDGDDSGTGTTGARPVSSMSVVDTSLVFKRASNGRLYFGIHDGRAGTVNDAVPDSWNIWQVPLEFDAVNLYEDGQLYIDIDRSDGQGGAVQSALDPGIRYAVTLAYTDKSGAHVVYTAVFDADIGDIHLYPDNSDDAVRFYDALAGRSGNTSYSEVTLTATVSDDPDIKPTGD